VNPFVANYTAELIDLRWLSPRSFELTVSRPAVFGFMPGQRIRVRHLGVDRDYSLASAPQDPVLTLCVRKIEHGLVSGRLAEMQPRSMIEFSGPVGYFSFQPSQNRPVFIATGTGVAPFRSMARSGVGGFMLLHGVSHLEDLYYKHELQSAADRYVPCLSGGPQETDGTFSGHVSDYAREKLPDGNYDFYLCGNGDMIRDVMLLADDRFPNARIYTELFY
jgi:ferredoxin-NADP reductase